jgi:hypothetical protein
VSATVEKICRDNEKETKTEKYKILRRLKLWEKLLELTLVLPTAA